MLFSLRRTDDADVIRARLRALLDDGGARPGWVPDDDLVDPWADPEEDSWSVRSAGAGPAVDQAGAPTAPVGVPVRGTGGRHRAAGPATRVDPGPLGTRTLWLVAVLAAVAVVLWSWAGRPDVSAVPDDGPPVSAAPAASTTSPSTLGSAGAASAGVVVVAVVGQVVSPGVVTLPAGSRVADALAAAGGLLPGTDPASVNAAALLVDGQQVAVGVPGAASADPDAGSSGSSAAAGGLVDLNTATLADLDALPGIGPVLAQRILDHRAQQGPFGSVQELDDVSGIGPSLFAEVSPLVTV